MNNKFVLGYRGFCIGIVLVSVLWEPITFAHEKGWVQDSEWVVAASRLTLEQAAEVLAGKTKGQILEGKSIQDDGKEVYEFKVLTPEDGRVRFIKVDPETGEIQGS